MNLSRNLVLLSLSALFSGLAFSIFYYQIRYFLYYQGYEYYVQSYIETLSYSIVMPALLIIGILSDLYGRKPFAVLSFILGGFACLVSSFLGDLQVGVFLSIVLFNASFYIGILTRGLLVVELSGGSPGRWIGIVMSSNSLAMIAGPLVRIPI
jgi:MFS family permease